MPKGKVLSIKKPEVSGDADLRAVMCISMTNGEVIVFKDDGDHWFEPCWAIPGKDKKGEPTVRFMPVQKYGMSKSVEPFLREQYLCKYPAEPGIEEHYLSFVQAYHEYINKGMN